MIKLSPSWELLVEPEQPYQQPWQDSKQQQQKNCLYSSPPYTVYNSKEGGKGRGRKVQRKTKTNTKTNNKKEGGKVKGREEEEKQERASTAVVKFTCQ